MGELVVIQQPRTGSPLPAVLGYFGILGSSKPSSVWTGGSAGPAPAVTVPSPGQVAAVLETLNTIAQPEQPQKITATGDSLRTPIMKARALRLPPQPYVYPGGSDPANNPPPLGPGGTFYPTPQPPIPGGGGGVPGGGGAAVTDTSTGEVAQPTFLGLTQTQLLVGGGLALAAFLLLRKKKPGSSSSAPASEAL